jgi:LPS-assembly protein
VDKSIMAVKKICIIALLLLLVCLTCPLLAAEGDTVQLDADRISFEEGSGLTTAEGNVRIYNSEMRLFAPYVEYDSAENRVIASSSPEGSVTFITASGRLSGERVDYNLATREGVFMKPSGKVEAFYVKGETLEVKPAQEARVDRRGKKSEGDPEDMAGKWSLASLTTCNLPHPHYRLEAKSVTVIEGESLIIRNPKVYLGETLLFSYPFDYFVSLGDADKRHKQVLFPKAGYESNKGAGLGITGAYGWGTGFAEIGVIGWTEDILEGDILLTQDVGENLSIYTDIVRAYDKDRDMTMWRPSWGARFDAGGWKANVTWAQRELMTLEKRSGSDSRYVVWKEPEFNIMSPWFEDQAVGGQFRLLGSWGRYEDATLGTGPTVTRTGLGAQIYGEFMNNREKIRPFYNAVYWHYEYDTDGPDTQRLLDSVFGIRWGFGKFDMESAYLRRWRWGESPMRWDAYDPREEVYQEIGYMVSTGKKDISWRLGVRAAYDIMDEELSEMVYKAAYDQHCMLWEAMYRDDREGTDNWFGLKLTIKAFPESGVRLGGSDLFDPFNASNELVPLETNMK